jgi:hypothetical protein
LASDNGTILVRPSPGAQYDSPYVEVVGVVENETTIREDSFTNFGENFGKFDLCVAVTAFVTCTWFLPAFVHSVIKALPLRHMTKGVLLCGSSESCRKEMKAQASTDCRRCLLAPFLCADLGTYNQLVNLSNGEHSHLFL